jgi:hypothetical protein
MRELYCVFCHSQMTNECRGYRKHRGQCMRRKVTHRIRAKKKPKVINVQSNSRPAHTSPHRGSTFHVQPSRFCSLPLTIHTDCHSTVNAVQVLCHHLWHTSSNSCHSELASLPLAEFIVQTTTVLCRFQFDTSISLKRSFVAKSKVQPAPQPSTLALNPMSSDRGRRADARLANSQFQQMSTFQEIRRCQIPVKSVVSAVQQFHHAKLAA